MSSINGIGGRCPGGSNQSAAMKQMAAAAADLEWVVAVGVCRCTAGMLEIVKWQLSPMIERHALRAQSHQAKVTAGLRAV